MTRQAGRKSVGTEADDPLATAGVGAEADGPLETAGLAAADRIWAGASSGVTASPIAATAAAEIRAVGHRYRLQLMLLRQPLGCVPMSLFYRLVFVHE
jgi:hypothetical protein